jgi:hypothetical protein
MAICIGTWPDEIARNQRPTSSALLKSSCEVALPETARLHRPHAHRKRQKKKYWGPQIASSPEIPRTMHLRRRSCASDCGIGWGYKGMSSYLWHTHGCEHIGLLGKDTRPYVLQKRISKKMAPRPHAPAYIKIVSVIDTWPVRTPSTPGQGNPQHRFKQYPASLA